MDKTIGRVLDVFIPKEYKDGKLLDIMDSTNIGFKIMTDNGLKKIILKQDYLNANIMKDDLIIITKQNISGKQFIDISLYDGDEYE